MEWGRRKGGEQGRCRREGEGEGGGGEEGKTEGRKKLYIPNNAAFADMSEGVGGERERKEGFEFE